MSEIEQVTVSMDGFEVNVWSDVFLALLTIDSGRRNPG